jgi:hypothetical protein
MTQETKEKMSVRIEYGEHPQHLYVSAAIYSREQLAALLAYLEIWGPDLPSQKASFVMAGDVTHD